MHKTGDQSAVPKTEFPSADDVPDVIDELVAPRSAPRYAERAKIHVVHTRRENDTPKNQRQIARIKRLLLTSIFGVLFLSAMAIFYRTGLVDQFVLKAAIVLITVPAIGF